jgi:hypothetical protein
MTTLQAHEHFARRDPWTGRSAFPVDATLDGGPDAWPAAATAACVLAGGLESAQDDSDLDELLEHFESLVNMGVTDDAKLEAETLLVLDELMRWGDEMERELATAGAAARSST